MSTAEPLTRDLGAVELEIIKAGLGGIVREMQNSLFRTGFSTIVRESQDASCAIIAPDGEVVAQHVVLPLHIGAFGACCRAVTQAYDDIREGDAFLINHPYEGGSPHAPDMAVITPAFHGGELVAFCGSIAHKGDIGGPVPGSCSGQAREVYNEGLQLPALRFQRGFTSQGDIERIIAANSRTPELVLGDIRGQLGCGRLGEQRLGELIGKFSLEGLRAAFARLLKLTELQLVESISNWPDGRSEAERFVDDDGVDLERPVRIHVVAEKKGDSLTFDFSDSADQTRGPANIRPPLVNAAVCYVLISLSEPGIFINSGLMRAFKVVLRDGSVLNPRFPAPVNTYNPTVHALVEALYGALGHMVPELARADGCGSRSIIIGGRSTYTGKSYVQYEIFGGGAGGRAGGDGISGTSVNHSNAKIAPVEIIESEFSVRVQRFELIPDSGGAGEYRGGLGIRREYLNLEDARFSIRSTKHIIGPNGLAGGLAGRTGAITVISVDGASQQLPTRYADYPLAAGDRFVLDTPGGGGIGDPAKRDPKALASDLKDGYVTLESAKKDYGVDITHNDANF
jgi:N-methylhydantoinase B